MFMLDNIILIDANCCPVQFISREDADKLNKGKRGIFRTNFLFQLNTVCITHFKPYDMYLFHIGDTYQIFINDENQDRVFEISFKKIGNVRLLIDYVNIDKIFVSGLTAEDENYLSDVSSYMFRYTDRLLNEIQKNMKNVQKKEKMYRYKFYLDASHSVRLNNVFGQSHPHTWEFVIEVSHKNDSIIIFNDIENLLKEILEPYQEKMINKIAPFDKINPTTENIGIYFKKIIEKKCDNMSWNLLKLEISETPSRGFIVT